MTTRAEAIEAAVEAAVASLVNREDGAGSDTEAAEVQDQEAGTVYVRGVVDVRQLVNEALLAFGA